MLSKELNESAPPLSRRLSLDLYCHTDIFTIGATDLGIFHLLGWPEVTVNTDIIRLLYINVISNGDSVSLHIKIVDTFTIS